MAKAQGNRHSQIENREEKGAGRTKWEGRNIYLKWSVMRANCYGQDITILFIND